MIIFILKVVLHPLIPFSSCNWLGRSIYYFWNRLIWFLFYLVLVILLLLYVSLRLPHVLFMCLHEIFMLYILLVVCMSSSRVTYPFVLNALFVCYIPLLLQCSFRVLHVLLCCMLFSCVAYSFCMLHVLFLCFMYFLCTLLLLSDYYRVWTFKKIQETRWCMDINYTISECLERMFASRNPVLLSIARECHWWAETGIRLYVACQ